MKEMKEAVRSDSFRRAPFKRCPFCGKVLRAVEVGQIYCSFCGKSLAEMPLGLSKAHYKKLLIRFVFCTITVILVVGGILASLRLTG